MPPAHEHPHYTHGPAGPTDGALLRCTLDAYQEQFGPRFWEMFSQEVAPLLPAQPVVGDLACGAGLLLLDLSRRLPEATLHGYDISPLMLEHARGLDWGRKAPALQQLDLAHAQLPLADRQVDLLTMTLALHHFDHPLQLLREVRRLLQTKGVFVLCEWDRLPFAEYLTQWGKKASALREEDWVGTFAHYGMVCRFSVEDWRYLLSVAGLEVLAVADLGNALRALVARPSGAWPQSPTHR